MNVYFFRLFRGKCSGCGYCISAQELVMKANGNVYHMNCFRCVECGHILQKGDQYVLKDGQLFCRFDFDKEFSVLSYSPKGNRKIFSSFFFSLSYIHVAWGKHMYLMWKDKFEHTRGTKFTSPNFISTINVSLVRDIFHKIYAKLRKRWVATAFHIQLCHSC